MGAHLPASLYYDTWVQHGNNHAAAARALDRTESAVRKGVARHIAAEGIDPTVKHGMDTVGLEKPPSGMWVKTHEPDELGRTYSFYVRGEQEQADEVDTVDRVREAMNGIRAVKLPVNKSEAGGYSQIGFIPINDLHSGGYAWSEETGYADWNIDTAVARLTDWIGRLIHRMPVVEECILFYNGDTMHTDGKSPFTPASKHVLDTSGTFYQAVDRTATAMTVVADLAAQKHRRVRIVVKRGNHDESSYIALLMAMKYRYADQPNVIVEEDPCPYWAYQYGNVFLFGHHGDRVKPIEMVMKMAADHPDIWGATRHRSVWTAHKHQREMKTFRGAVWEQASCLTDPDAYGAYWGSNALAQAVIYHKEKGETDRFTVRP